MGLDMYAFTRPGSVPQPVDFEAHDADERIAYWRKHPNLHGWMERLYREKGGKDEDFNCVPVELTLADLDRLEADIRADMLPSTSGFFFGVSDGTERKEDLDFVEQARAEIAAGKAVFYTSWW